MLGSRGTGALVLRKSDFFHRKSVLPFEQEMLDCDNSEFLSDDEVDGRWCGSVRERNA